jgi:hypothetical protein
MSFIHYLYLGYFEHDGNAVRFSKEAGDSVFKPVVRRPFESEVIKAVLQEVKGTTVNELAFPDDWLIGVEDGYLVCDKYIRNPEAIHFVALLVERARCDIYDVAAHCALTLQEWLALTHGCSRS